MTDSVKLGFVCVQNAGRSQMSAAFARQERKRRGLENEVGILTGGTHPADEIHPEVVKVMQEVGVDLSDQEPQEVSTAELNECDVVVTMGCSTLELEADVEVRDWALEDPHGKEIKKVREIRDEIEQLVTNLFDEYVGKRRADDSQAM
jgi:arsenate reductase